MPLRDNDSGNTARQLLNLDSRFLLLFPTPVQCYPLMYLPAVLRLSCAGET